MAAQIGHGTTLSYATTSNSTAFTSLTLCKAITPPKPEATDVDVTNLTSANFTKEFIPGLLNGGEITLPISYDETATSTVFALLRSSKWWKITLPDTTYWMCNGYVKGFGTEELSSESEVTNTMSIKIGAKPAFANVFVDATYLDTTKTLGVSLTAVAVAADWTASSVEIFTSGIWVPATSVTQDSDDLLFTSASWPNSVASLPYRILTGPSYVVVPQTGTTHA